VDVLVSATTAPGCVVDAALLERLSRVTPSGQPLIAIDLAVPRDVAAAPNDHVVVIDLDDLRAEAARSRALRAEAAGVAEQLVDAKVDTFSRRLGEQAVAPTVSELHAIGHDILESELSGLLNGRFAHLEDGDRRALERWARSTYKRLMHHPISALKRLANEQAPELAPEDPPEQAPDEAAPRAPAEDLR
jgi:glutamyl-tRNA reductase